MLSTNSGARYNGFSDAARTAATHRAIAGLVSDRAAQRTTRRKPSTELVRVSSTAC